jgi:hypothetical protein
MIRITITAYFHAICSTLPEDAPLWPVHRQIEAAVLDRLRAMRRPGEDYNDLNPAALWNWRRRGLHYTCHTSYQV